MQHGDSAEFIRIKEDAERVRNWKRWGPYLSDRQWGTVREDYSPDSEVWTHFLHEHARSRAYRWGEDGLLGISDRQCRLCFGLALWNGRDHILKERLFGLTNGEGNHGEDVKECYYFLEATPTHSYLKALYKYPQAPFPYEELIAENARRTRLEPEYELIDTGIFDDGAYFDVFVEYAKADTDDILIRITVENRGNQPADIHVLPTVWFRNIWRWGAEHESGKAKPKLWREGPGAIGSEHETLGRFRFAIDDAEGPVPLIFTENDSNRSRLFGVPNVTRYVKDAFHDYVIAGREAAVNPEERGTKAAAWFRKTLPAGGSWRIQARLYADRETAEPHFGPAFDACFEQRQVESRAFHEAHMPDGMPESSRPVLIQARAGLIWSKQFYNYVVTNWLEGDPNFQSPPASRKKGRNSEWKHLHARDILSMPDTWEYPWFAAWDTAFHMLPYGEMDPGFAKNQLELFLREWYLHPNGQIPAYEFNFSDVNPPVHAWACWRVFKMTGERGHRDRQFLERVFHKLLMNFTWWVNRKDPHGNNLFSGGFLGLDNIGVFDRSKPLPMGGELEQADGTAWMAFYCSTMLAMSLELAWKNPAYEDIASKFFEHFVHIVDAMNHLGENGLWDEEDGFYYDQVYAGGHATPIRVRSLVGLIPLLTVEVLKGEQIENLHGFRKRLDWFLNNRRDLHRTTTYLERRTRPDGKRWELLAIPTRDRLLRILAYMLDENEFLSPYGIRSLSRVHEKAPFTYTDPASGNSWTVAYVPGESDSGMFGGNSNWRGPIWFPLNYLLIEALERYHYFYGDDLKVECPTGSGNYMNLLEVAREVASRLIRLFKPDATGARPAHGGDRRYAEDPHWKDLILFYEYFHGETGEGLGASHQTGWTALVTRLMTRHDLSAESAAGTD
ncbi:MAG: glucosidase [Candidatus Hydrogenedentes bacterium]|nr:glucosidase [Candidatus Hydrogenedentota bacterium]